MSDFDSDIGQFGIVPMWLIDVQVGSNAIHVFAVIAGKWADRQSGYAWPSVRTIAEATGMSENTVRVAIAALEQAGALRVERRRGDDGKDLTNRYRLLYAHPKRREGSGFEDGGRVQILKGEGAKLPDRTSIRTRISEPESVRPLAQSSMFAEEQAETRQVILDMFAEAFRRKGTQRDRERVTRLVRLGATVVQAKNAIEVTKREKRDDPVRYALGVIGRFVKESVDGDADVRGVDRGGTGDAGHRAHPSPSRPGGVARQRPGPGTAAADYADDF